jgi:hypothetical protein
MLACVGNHQMFRTRFARSLELLQQPLPAQAQHGRRRRISALPVHRVVGRPSCSSDSARLAPSSRVVRRATVRGSDPRSLGSAFRRLRERCADPSTYFVRRHNLWLDKLCLVHAMRTPAPLGRLRVIIPITYLCPLESRAIAGAALGLVLWKRRHSHSEYPAPRFETRSLSSRTSRGSEPFAKPSASCAEPSV